MHVDPAERSRKAGNLQYRRVHFRQAPLLLGNDEHVDVIGGVDGEIGKIVGDRLQNRDDKVVVQLIHLEPLHENAFVGQMAVQQPVKLLREQPGDTADPRVGRLRNDDVILLVVGRKEGLGILDVDLAARVRIYRLDTRSEVLGSLHHELLDLDGIHLSQVRVAKKRLGGKP